MSFLIGMIVGCLFCTVIELSAIANELEKIVKELELIRKHRIDH